MVTRLFRLGKKARLSNSFDAYSPGNPLGLLNRRQYRDGRLRHLEQRGVEKVLSSISQAIGAS
jgi:hypothetical protein